MAPIDARKKLEQIKRNKNKTRPQPHVRDLRQLISRRRKSTEGNERRGVTKTGGPRDLREVNKKLAARKNMASVSKSSTHGPNRAPTNSNNNPGNKKTTTMKRLPTNARSIKPQIQYYIPPHMQQQQPTYIIAPAAAPSNLAMDNESDFAPASILISNLIPTVTQSDIIEIFGGIGDMTAVNMINPTTALITYKKSTDAVTAMKHYHGRSLDGQPMYVNMMPNSTASPVVRSRIRHS